MSDKELKPCPFCGSKPKFFKPKDFEEQEQIYCCPNGCTAGLTKDEWNTRPTPPLVELDENDIEAIAKKAYECWGKQPGKEWVCTWDELGQWHKDFDKFLIKQALAKFGTPQKVHACRCRAGQEGAMTVKRIDDGLYECPRCEGIIVYKPAKKESLDWEKVLPCFLPEDIRRFIHDITLFIQSHRSKSAAQMDDMFQKSYILYSKYDVENANPDPRFVEVGKIELPKKLTHINQVPPMDSTMKACGYFDGWNNAIYACKAAVEAAGLEYGLDKRKKGKEK